MSIKTALNLAIIVGAIFVSAAIMFVAGFPLQASTTDNRIEATVHRSYVFKTYLKGDNIKVHFEDGRITLTGYVSGESHKSMAEALVMSLPEVESVSNELKVTGPPATDSSDARLRERVVNTLLFHRSVSDAYTDVSATNATVTLRGMAASDAQKQLTTEYVEEVSGVKDVDNRMIVTKSLARSHGSSDESIDDASITTQVRMSLLFHYGTDLPDLKVSTRQGVVTLFGTVKNQAEMDLASRRVSDVHGVRRVDNQMRIEAARTSTN